MLLGAGGADYSRLPTVTHELSHDFFGTLAPMWFLGCSNDAPRVDFGAPRPPMESPKRSFSCFEACRIRRRAPSKRTRKNNGLRALSPRSKHQQSIQNAFEEQSGTLRKFNSLRTSFLMIFGRLGGAKTSRKWGGSSRFFEPRIAHGPSRAPWTAQGRPERAPGAI